MGLIKPAFLFGASMLALAQAQAQQPSPAQMGITPQTTPEVLQVLDNTQAWVPIGSVDPTTHTAIGLGKEFYVRQFGPYNDWAGDDGPAIAAALNAASAAGGGTVYLDQKSYWNQTKALVVPRGVRLTCIGSFTKSYIQAQDQTNFPCTIYQKAGASLVDSGAVTNVGVMQDQVHFQPMATASRAQMEAFIAGFTGTGVSLNDASKGSGALLENVYVGGFSQCIAINGVAQTQVRHILGDCTNGLDIANSHDDNFLFGIEFWQSLTCCRTHTYDHWTISALADNGSGRWRVTTSATNDIRTGEIIWIAPNASPGAGAGGQWVATSIDSTHFDLQGSATAPSTVGDTTTGLTYIANVGSTANLAAGMNVSGAGIPAGATVGAVWRTRNAISLDQTHAATATATGVTLSFSSAAYTGAPGVAFVDNDWRAGTGFAIGAADGTMCSQCFAFDFQTGYNFRSAIATGFINAEYDQVAGVPGAVTPHLANQNVVPIGVEFTGSSGTGSYGNIWKGSLITFAGVGILNNMTVGGINGSTGNTVEVNRLASSSNFGTFIEHVAGGLTVKDAQTQNGGEILIDNAASTPFLIGNRLPSALLFSTGVQPNFQDGRNQFTGTNVSQVAPTLLVAQSLSAANMAGAAINLSNYGQATDEKIWRWYWGGVPSGMCLQAVNDAYTVPANALCAHRAGITVNDVTYTAPLIATATGQASLFVNSTDGASAGGGIRLNNTTSGATAPQKTLRVSTTGQFQVLSNDFSTALINVDDTGNGSFPLTVRTTTAFTIGGTLPACSASLKGASAYVSNGQASPPYLGAVSATGSTVAPVFCNGSGWVYH